jgi:hypothetical protein
LLAAIKLRIGADIKVFVAIKVFVVIKQFVAVCHLRESGDPGGVHRIRVSRPARLGPRFRGGDSELAG